MSNNPQPQKASSALTNPQVITAIIGGVVTLVAAIIGFLPTVLNRAPQPTAVIVVTATLPPATATLFEPTTLPTNVPPTDVPVIVIEPTTTPLPPSATPVPPMPTSIPPTATLIPPTATSIPPTPIPPTPVPAQPANALFMWDDVSFTAINISASRLSLVGVTFNSSRGFWDARDWGPSLYNSVPPRDCLRLRDATAGQRNPPSECGDLYGLILVGASAIFWRGTDSFDVVHDGQVIATCPVAAGRCEVYVG